MELNSDNEKIIHLLKALEIEPFIPDTNTRFLLEQQITLCKTLSKTLQKNLEFNESPMPLLPAFVPDPIKAYINEAPVKNTYSFVLHMRDKTANISITFFRKIVKRSLLQFIAKKMELWLQLACNYYAPAHCSRTLNVQIFMTELKKTLPTNGEPIEPANANTAFTTSCSETTNIVLFRREEWFKVFIHETFHCLGLDFSAHAGVVEQSKRAILSIFNIKSDVRLFETYCEMWADTMNLIVCNVLDHPHMDVKQTMNLTTRQLNIERKFALFQAAKVLAYYETSYQQLFDKSVRPKFVEKTEVFCYYILRSLLMYDLNVFYNWCLRSNQGSLAFINPTVNVPKYMKIFGFHNEGYKRTIENINVLQMTRGQKFLRETMRMTVL
jgi:hypothetical protein